MNIKDFIREIPDFPKEWINFKDISPILGNPDVLSYVVDWLSAGLDNVDKIVGLDARGFIFGSLVAYRLNKPFVMVRKKWKLPGKCKNISYSLEYGENILEIQEWAIKKWEKIAIIDDLLATGGTAKATCDLIESLWWKVENLGFVIELEFLNWKNNFKDKKVYSLVKYN
jgi:adenine phosphoribosyltransferase